MSFVTADATSLAQTRYVNAQIEAILQRLVNRAGGNLARAGSGIGFIDEIDKLKTGAGTAQRTFGEGMQYALLKMDGICRAFQRWRHQHGPHAATHLIAHVAYPKRADG